MNKTKKKHWTVISYDGNGDWADQTEEFSSQDAAVETAKSLAEASANGRFVVVEHIALGAYARSTNIVVSSA